jgi:hypothetical protein
MIAIFVSICSFVILLGFEIRYREIVEEVTKLKTKANILDEEVFRLKEEMKMKKNIYEESSPR